MDTNLEVFLFEALDEDGIGAGEHPVQLFRGVLVYVGFGKDEEDRLVAQVVVEAHGFADAGT